MTTAALGEEDQHWLRQCCDDGYGRAGVPGTSREEERAPRMRRSDDGYPYPGPPGQGLTSLACGPLP